METPLTERVPLFILIDTDLKGLIPFFEYVNELDDKPVLSLDDLSNGITDYEPNGSFHVVDIHNDLKSLTRWEQLVWASLGVRAFSNDFDEDSPIYAGMVPESNKARRAGVDAKNAETRAVHFAEFGVNYIGRSRVDPRNLFVLDNKKGNPLHDPSKDATLEALYASLPADWWGSCGFVSTSNVSRLETFLASFNGDVIPLAYTSGAFAKLKFSGLEYVEVAPPVASEKYGIQVRDLANRKSYELSQPTTPQEIEEPKVNTWLQL
jgi:hypothetical protein